MGKISFKKQRDVHKQMQIDKLVESFDIPPKAAARIVGALNKDTIDKIMDAKLPDLKNAYIASEQEINRAREETAANVKYKEAKEVLDTLNKAMRETIKPYKVANNLRMKVMEYKSASAEEKKAVQ
jgi:hypothetical protein